MAGEIVNLRRARKERDRAARETEAAENRRLFGRTLAEKRKTDDERARAKTHLDGHRIGPAKDDPA